MGNAATLYKAQRAKIRRDLLMRQLGGKCVDCGTREALEFDHRDPRTRTWRNRDFSQMGRQRMYERDASRGLLQPMCKSCNSSKNDRLPKSAAAARTDRSGNSCTDSE